MAGVGVVRAEGGTSTALRGGVRVERWSMSVVYVYSGGFKFQVGGAKLRGWSGLRCLRFEG